MLKKKVSEFKLIDDKSNLPVSQKNNNNIKIDLPKTNSDFRTNSGYDTSKTLNSKKSVLSVGAMKNNLPIKNKEITSRNPAKNIDQLSIDLDDDKY